MHGAHEVQPAPRKPGVPLMTACVFIHEKKICFDSEISKKKYWSHIYHSEGAHVRKESEEAVLFFGFLVLFCFLLL